MTKIGGSEGLRDAPDKLNNFGMTEAPARKDGTSKELGSGAVATLETFARMARGRLRRLLLGANNHTAQHSESRAATNSKGKMVGVEASRFAPPEAAVTAVRPHPEVDPRTGLISPFAQGSGEVPPAVNSVHAVSRRVGGEPPIGIDMVVTGERGLGLKGEPIGPMIEVPKGVKPAPGVDSPESTK